MTSIAHDILFIKYLFQDIKISSVYFLAGFFVERYQVNALKPGQACYLLSTTWLYVKTCAKILLIIYVLQQLMKLILPNFI